MATLREIKKVGRKPGFVSPRKGKKFGPMSEEHKALRRGHTPWNKGKKTGIIPWNKGINGEFKHSEESRKKISLAGMGRPSWNIGLKIPCTKETAEKISKSLIGKKLSSQHREKCAKVNKGRKQSAESIEKRRQKMIGKKIMLGRKHSKEANEAKSISMLGSKNRNWKGGVSAVSGYLSARRKMAMDKAEGFHTKWEWDLLKIQYGYICPCCKIKEPIIKLTKDHIIPISKGGADFIENIQPLCKRCNSKKYTKTIKY